MKKIYRTLIISITSVLLIATSVLITLFSNNQITVNYFPVDEIVADEVIELTREEKIQLPKIDGKEFTCTGMTYDSDSNLFWICNYGKETADDIEFSPSIVAFDLSMQVMVKTIHLDISNDSSLQGITYDSKTQSLWFTTGNVLYNISKNGEIINRFSTSYQYNGLLFDYKKDVFYVLCYKRYLLTINRHNEVIENRSVNYLNQDQLSFDGNGNILITVGNDYLGDDNYVVTYNLGNNISTTKYRVLDSNSVEGIVYHNNKLYICNDGFYHNAKDKSNWISVYSV